MRADGDAHPDLGQRRRHPVQWTKTADEILKSLADYLAKLGSGQPENLASLAGEISDAGH